MPEVTQELDGAVDGLCVSDGEMADRYLCLDIEGGVWEMEDVEGENEYRKTKLNGNREFTTPAARFDMYARLGMHYVIGMSVTDAQFDDLAEKITDLDEDSRLAFAREMAMEPPE